VGVGGGEEEEGEREEEEEEGGIFFFWVGRSCSPLLRRVQRARAAGLISCAIISSFCNNFIFCNGSSEPVLLGFSRRVENHRPCMCFVVTTRLSGTPKEPYITHKRSLGEPKRDLVTLLLRSGTPKEPYITHKRALHAVKRSPALSKTELCILLVLLVLLRG
jgi:hypothetical protein